MQTYLFYDIETTGLNKAFDQVLHFAAIRTDLNLKELERYELRVKLNPDLVPSPQALLTHQISIEDTLKGETEYNAIKKIHQYLNAPGTISLGYNTFNFDDEFLRFSFYRNLLPPYTHQYANQCSRMDIYPMTVMYYLYKNNVLTWPKNANEKISLKLADINASNQLVAGRAHDAMVDVEATLALARCLFKEKEMWNYLSASFNKKTDQERISQLSQREALLVEGIFGPDQHYQSPVYFLGYHHHYKNQSLWLSLDMPEIQNCSLDEFIPYTKVKNKKVGEPGFIVPMKTRFVEHLSSDRLKLMEENKNWLKQNPAILEKIGSHYRNYTYPEVPETDADARLYMNGFMTFEEENFCKIFHITPPKEKALLAQKIQNPVLSALATRIIGRHFPETLTQAQQEAFTEYLRQTTHTDYKGHKKLTPEAALSEITALLSKNTLDEKQTALLKSLEVYINKHFSGF